MWRDFIEGLALIGRIFADPTKHKCARCGALLLAEDQDGHPACPDCRQRQTERSSDDGPERSSVRFLNLVRRSIE